MGLSRSGQNLVRMVLLNAIGVRGTRYLLCFVALRSDRDSPSMQENAFCVHPNSVSGNNSGALEMFKPQRGLAVSFHHASDAAVEFQFQDHVVDGQVAGAAGGEEAFLEGLVLLFQIVDHARETVE